MKDRQAQKQRFERVNDSLAVYYRRLISLAEERDKEFSRWLVAQLEVLGGVSR